jgi:hypothetical protein
MLGGMLLGPELTKSLGVLGSLPLKSKGVLVDLLPCDTSSWRKELMERRAELRARRLERKQRLGQQKK